MNVEIKQNPGYWMLNQFMNYSIEEQIAHCYCYTSVGNGFEKTGQGSAGQYCDWKLHSGMNAHPDRGCVGVLDADWRGNAVNCAGYWAEVQK